MMDAPAPQEIDRSNDEQGFAASCWRLAASADPVPARCSNGMGKRPSAAMAGDNEGQVSGGQAEATADPAAGAMTPSQSVPTSLLSSLG